MLPLICHSKNPSKYPKVEQKWHRNRTNVVLINDEIPMSCCAWYSLFLISAPYRIPNPKNVKKYFLFQSEIAPVNIKMLQDVYCPDKTCFETHVFQPKCEILSGQNCSAPCDDSECQIEIEYNVICAVWDCKPIPTTTMPTSTANPTPEPAAGADYK